MSGGDDPVAEALALVIEEAEDRHYNEWTASSDMVAVARAVLNFLAEQPVRLRDKFDADGISVARGKPIDADDFSPLDIVALARLALAEGWIDDARYHLFFLEAIEEIDLRRPRAMIGRRRDAQATPATLTSADDDVGFTVTIVGDHFRACRVVEPRFAIEAASLVELKRPGFRGGSNL